MCASWPFQISSEAVAELIASDLGDPDYLVRLPFSSQLHTSTSRLQSWTLDPVHISRSAEQKLEVRDYDAWAYPRRD